MATASALAKLRERFCPPVSNTEESGLPAGSVLCGRFFGLVGNQAKKMLARDVGSRQDECGRLLQVAQVGFYESHRNSDRAFHEYGVLAKAVGYDRADGGSASER